MQVIFSCEDKPYMWWQAELLHHTYLRAGMQAELTALVATTGEQASKFTCNTFRVANYKDLVDRPLLSLNKPGGIAEWAALDGPSDETVLIVDPDSVFVRQVSDPGPIPEGEAYSEEHAYLAVDLPENQLVIDRHCKREFRDRVQPVGVYVFTNRACLAESSQLWLQKSVEIASDPVCREALGGSGWISEMWGYAVAAAELGIRHHIKDFSQVTGSSCLRHPIIHYCYPLLVEQDRRWRPDIQRPILWSKWGYIPWDDPPDPNAATAEGRVLLEHLWELVIAKRSQLDKRQIESPPL